MIHHILPFRVETVVNEVFELIAEYVTFAIQSMYGPTRVKALGGDGTLRQRRKVLSVPWMKGLKS